MINQEVVNELIDFTSSETIRSFGSESKKAYKYLLCGILRDIFFYGNYTIPTPTSTFYGWARFMRDMRKMKFIDQSGGYPAYIEAGKSELASSFFKNPNDTDAIINFFRYVLNDMKTKNNSLFTVSEIKKIFNVEEYFTYQGTPLKPHHWVEVSFYNGLVPTHPEFFNYMDVINLWNDLIEKNNRFQVIDRDSNDYRELNYSLVSSMRWLIIQAVTYVEAYLYYYYYNASHNNNIKDRLPKLKGYIQDTQIIEDVILKLHPEIKENADFMHKYQLYKQILKTRDRFVHTSAFQNKMNQLSELAPLLDVSLDTTITYLTVCFEFVDQIEKSVSEDESILYWKERFEPPIFSKKQKISALNIYR